MIDVARKRGPATELDDLPDSFKQLEGFDKITVESVDGDRFAKFDSGDGAEPAAGMWRVQMSVPVELAELRGHLDPLLVLLGLASAAEQVETKLAEVVRYCRIEGKTWTQIGEALGMSKQAAWERYSGEE